MYNPPNPRLTPRETALLLAVYQAKIVPFGGKTRVATKVDRGRHGNTRRNDTLFQIAIEGISLNATNRRWQQGACAW